VNKPEGPTPPSGYRLVEEGHLIWPTDVIEIQQSGVPTLVQAQAVGASYLEAGDGRWLRAKVTQPDLAWLKSKALDQAKLHPKGSVERERIMWAITEAVRTYSESLRALVPEREQWRPGQEVGVSYLPARRININNDEGDEV
jgi:hypothetical protein